MNDSTLSWHLQLDSQPIQDPTINQAQEDAQEQNDSIHLQNNQRLSRAISA
jgi:hypothetical protein